MSYRVETTSRFDRQAAKFFRKHRDLQPEFARLVDNLRVDPFEPDLRLHGLSGELLGTYAVSLTFKYRVTLTIMVTDELITLIDIGSYDEVYR